MTPRTSKECGVTEVVTRGAGFINSVHTRRWRVEAPWLARRRRIHIADEKWLLITIRPDPKTYPLGLEGQASSWFV